MLLKINSILINTDAIAAINLDAEHPDKRNPARGVLIEIRSMAGSWDSSGGGFSPSQYWFGGEEAECLRAWFTSIRSGVIDLDRLWKQANQDGGRR